MHALCVSPANAAKRAPSPSEDAVFAATRRGSKRSGRIIVGGGGFSQ